MNIGLSIWLFSLFFIFIGVGGLVMFEIFFSVKMVGFRYFFILIVLLLFFWVFGIWCFFFVFFGDCFFFILNCVFCEVVGRFVIWLVGILCYKGVCLLLSGYIDC